ncbi:hypothetical protein BS50DRAFT_586728 [Corynespora cassiicola Philippines]|uniref:Uncharacterized protein n=1 Tax=Corynespora cassiicola Philippines TaxID=1448308 RepID=A0A2T2NVF9_CORCC|nr:hypothetical protein BS50DRAFT_586728 [Corynespora cassiicola Philippines]
MSNSNDSKDKFGQEYRLSEIRIGSDTHKEFEFFRQVIGSIKYLESKPDFFHLFELHVIEEFARFLRRIRDNVTQENRCEEPDNIEDLIRYCLLRDDAKKYRNQKTEDNNEDDNDSEEELPNVKEYHKHIRFRYDHLPHI